MLEKILEALSAAGVPPASLLSKIIANAPLVLRITRELKQVTGDPPNYGVAVDWLEAAQPFIASLTPEEFAFLKKAAAAYGKAA